jgi:branched-chain amino acid transport system permease protein
VDGDAYRYLFFGIVLGLLALVALAVEAVARSPWGRVLRALREDEAATTASGKDVLAAKTQSFVFGAAIMGMAGALFAVQQGATSPDAFNHFVGTFLFWAMLIVGGSGNTAGAVAGAYVVWGLWAITLQLQGYDLPGGAAVQSRIPHLRDLLVGVAIVAVLLLAPRGLLPERMRVSRWLERGSALRSHRVLRH